MELYNFDFSRKVFHHPDRILDLQSGKRPFPVTMEMDLSNRCNHRCSFCFYAEHIAEDKSTLSLEVAQRTIQDARDLGLRGISFTGGGEPTIHPHYREIASFSKAIGLSVGTISNGSAITEDNVDEIVRALNWIRISVAGGDEVSYAKVQGVDQFHRVLTNIKRLTEARDRIGAELNVGVRTLVTPENISSLLNLATELQWSKISYLQFAPDQNTSDGGAFWNSEASQRVFSEVKDLLLPRGIRLLTTRYLMDQPDLQRPTSCWAHHFMFLITAEGHVGFCKNARGAEQFYVGNVNEQSLEQIWAGQRNTEIESWVKPSNCGLFCKHMAINSAMEDIMNPHPDLSRDFVG